MIDIPFTTQDVKLAQTILKKMQDDGQVIFEYRQRVENNTPIVTFYKPDPLNDDARKMNVIIKVVRVLEEEGVKGFMYSKLK